MPTTEAREDGRDWHPGDVIRDEHGSPRYIISDLLHAGGGEGRIFLAADIDSGDVVAVKQFRGDLAAGGPNTALADRLRRLRALALQLQRVPGLVRYLEPFQGPPPTGADTPSQRVDLTWYLPMEHVVGNDIATILERGLTGSETLDVLKALRGVADTLEQLAARPQPLAHRDLKPANIVISTDQFGHHTGTLVDIGLMTRADRLHLSTYGSNGYLAPEILDHSGQSAFAHNADWYSFTATVYAVVTSANPPAAPERWAADLRARAIPPALAATLVAAGTATPARRPHPRTLIEDVIHALESATTGHVRNSAPPSRHRARPLATLLKRALLVMTATFIMATAAWVVTGRALPFLAAPTTNATLTGSAPSRAGTLIVSAGGSHTCSIKKDHTTWCWGDNTFNESGPGPQQRHAPVQRIAAAEGATFVAAGAQHTCALMNSGEVRCWGANDHGQLGDGTTTSRGTPKPVPGLTGATALVVNGNSTCALATMGTAYCWGDTSFLTPTTEDGNTSLHPTAIPALTGATQLAVTSDHICAVVGRDNVECLGRNDVGQLGDGTTQSSPTLKPVKRLTRVRAVSVSAGVSCAVETSGSVACWGRKTIAETLSAGNVLPQTIPGFVGVTHVELTDDSACLLGSGGYVYCWGSNAFGQLGNGTTTNETIPRPVPDLHPVTQLTGGPGFMCALVHDRISCWGLNDSGQLGVQSRQPFSPLPVAL